MSQENVEVAVKQSEATNASDFAGVMDTWAEDVTLILHWKPPLRVTVTGKAAAAEWLEYWLSRFGRDHSFEIEETHDTGDRVLIVGTNHGHDGLAVERRSAHVYTLREGEVSRIEVWANQDAREAGLEAVGLRD